MVDVTLEVRTVLAADAGVAALTGSRIYGERDVPPPGYKPSDGGAICVKVRGGSLDYASAWVGASMQMKCYGEDEVAANDVYLATVDALHDYRSWPLRHAAVEVAGQTLEEPGSLWPFVLCFFRVQVVKE